MQSNNLFPTILAPTRVAATLRQDGQYITTQTMIDLFKYAEYLPIWNSGLVDYWSLPNICITKKSPTNNQWRNESNKIQVNKWRDIKEI